MGETLARMIGPTDDPCVVCGELTTWTLAILYGGRPWRVACCDECFRQGGRGPSRLAIEAAEAQIAQTVRAAAH